MLPSEQCEPFTRLASTLGAVDVAENVLLFVNNSLTAHKICAKAVLETEVWWAKHVKVVRCVGLPSVHAGKKVIAPSGRKKQSLYINILVISLLPP